MKIFGPLHSNGVSGRFGNLLTFSQRKEGQICRIQNRQVDKITPLRTAQREKFLVAKEMWPLNDFGKIEFGFNLAGGQKVHISSLPKEQRAPQFARFVSDVINFYL